MNLKEMKAGTMRRGYTITRDGITLGLTAKAVGEGYLYEKLNEHTGVVKDAAARQGGVRDWDSSQGWVVVGGVKTEMSGMLLDTGLTNMMLQSPNSAAKGDVPDGTEVSVHLLSGRLSYRFKVGDTTDRKSTRLNSSHG